MCKDPVYWPMYVLDFSLILLGLSANYEVLPYDNCGLHQTKLSEWIQHTVQVSRMEVNTQMYQWGNSDYLLKCCLFII